MNTLLEKLVSEYVNSRDIRQLEVEFLLQEEEYDIVSKMRIFSFNKVQCFALLDEIVAKSRAMIDSVTSNPSLKDGVRYTYDILQLDTTGVTRGRILHRALSFKETIEKLQSIRQVEEYGLDINKYAVNLRERVTDDIVKKQQLSIPSFVNLFDLQGVVEFSDSAEIKLIMINDDIKSALQVIERDKLALTQKVANLETLVEARKFLMYGKPYNFIDDIWAHLFPWTLDGPSEGTAPRDEPEKSTLGTPAGAFGNAMGPLGQSS